MDMTPIAPTRQDSQPMMLAEDLKVHFPIRRGFFKRVVGHVKAVDGITLAIHPGETLSVVGESGCGKTTFGQALVRVLEPTHGKVLYRKDGGEVDLAHLDPNQLRPYRSDIRMIFQDPFASLNPRRRVIDIIAEPMRNFGMTDEAEVEANVAELLRKVGLRPEYMSRYPYAFSGGERQRIGIAQGAVGAPKAGGRRRMRFGARCLDPGADPQPLARPAGRVRPDLSVHFPRSGRGRIYLRPCGGHVCRAAWWNWLKPRRCSPGRAIPIRRRFWPRCRAPIRVRRARSSACG